MSNQSSKPSASLFPATPTTAAFNSSKQQLTGDSPAVDGKLPSSSAVSAASKFASELDDLGLDLDVDEKELDFDTDDFCID